MNLTSVSGKTWLFNKFNDLLVKKISEQYSLNETVSKLLSVRNKNFDNI